MNIAKPWYVWEYCSLQTEEQKNAKVSTTYQKLKYFDIWQVQSHSSDTWKSWGHCKLYMSHNSASATMKRFYWCHPGLWIWTVSICPQGDTTYVRPQDEIYSYKEQSPSSTTLMKRDQSPGWVELRKCLHHSHRQSQSHVQASCSLSCLFAHVMQWGLCRCGVNISIQLENIQGDLFN